MVGEMLLAIPWSGVLVLATLFEQRLQAILEPTTAIQKDVWKRYWVEWIRKDLEGAGLRGLSSNRLGLRWREDVRTLPAGTRPSPACSPSSAHMGISAGPVLRTAGLCPRVFAPPVRRDSERMDT